MFTFPYAHLAHCRDWQILAPCSLTPLCSNTSCGSPALPTLIEYEYTDSLSVSHADTADQVRCVSWHQLPGGHREELAPASILRAPPSQTKRSPQQVTACIHAILA